MNDPLPTDYLEQRAAAERQRLHQSVTDCAAPCASAWTYRTARSYLWRASAAAGTARLWPWLWHCRPFTELSRHASRTCTVGSPLPSARRAAASS